MTDRVLVGGFMHEVHTFMPGAITLDDMRQAGFVAVGDEMLGPSIGSRQELHGAMAVAEREGLELVPSVHAFAGVGPRVADEAFAFLRGHLLDAARANQGRLAGVYLVLHGASATQSLDDPEGDVLEALRDILGPDVPIVASFDLHAHFTDRMVTAADALIAYRTIPHLDFYETGERAMTLLVDAIRGRTHPVVRQRKLRMIASAERHDTNHGPMVGVMAYARQLEERPGVLAVSVTPTQPWMDVPELGWSVTVVADGDEALAQACADELGWFIWARREQFLLSKTPVPEAVAEAIATPGKPIVLADAADSPSAGGNGDGNLLLKELLRIDYRGGAIMTVVDPVAAAACIAAGVGATVSILLGGALTPDYFTPVEVTGRVVSISDGKYFLEVPRRPADIGPTAVLDVHGIHIVVSPRKGFLLDRSIFLHAGLDPADWKIVQVKSAGGFRGIYEPFAARIIELDTPGPCTHELTRLPFRRITRPLWPFDPDLAEPWTGADQHVPPSPQV